jgi:hypothetical protein
VKEQRLSAIGIFLINNTPTLPSIVNNCAWYDTRKIERGRRGRIEGKE